MHFGRIEDKRGAGSGPNVDLNLPPDAPRTQAFLRLPWRGSGRLYAGAPVWAEPGWVGSLYPSGTKSADFLTAYARQFGTTEVNSTFYQLLDETRVRAWASRVPADFKFCPKVYRDITEHPGGSELNALVQRCAASFAAFGSNYGLGFAQFPETFGPEQLPLLKRFLTVWPHSLPLAVELRHPGWFRNHALLDEAVNLLYRAEAATVITDTPGRRDVLHTSLSRPRVMVRFLGGGSAHSDQRRLSAWAERLLAWSNKGLDELYMLCHQPEAAAIPETVNRFLLALQMRGVMEPPVAKLAPTAPSLFAD